MVDWSQFAAVQKLLGVSINWVEPALMYDGEEPLAVFCSFQDGVRLGNRHSERLFTNDMQPGGESRYGRLRVLPMRSGYDDRVYLPALNKCFGYPNHFAPSFSAMGRTSVCMSVTAAKQNDGQSFTAAA